MLAVPTLDVPPAPGACSCRTPDLGLARLSLTQSLIFAAAVSLGPFFGHGQVSMFLTSECFFLVLSEVDAGKVVGTMAPDYWQCGPGRHAGSFAFPHVRVGTVSLHCYPLSCPSPTQSPEPASPRISVPCPLTTLGPLHATVSPPVPSAILHTMHWSGVTLAAPCSLWRHLPASPGLCTSVMTGTLTLLFCLQMSSGWLKPPFRIHLL